MRGVRRIAALAASLTLTTTALVAVTAAPASAAAPWCNTATATYSKSQPGWIKVPARITRTSETVLCTMGRGAVSPAVSQLQRTLNRCYGERLKVDSAYGPKTKAAVERAQRTHRIRRDGVYGPQTARTIRHIRESGGCARM